jgi:hypothetical protein
VIGKVPVVEGKIIRDEVGFFQVAIFVEREFSTWM